ncbi:MAG: bifunctional oligoribonuclease/PAP phosphatase NrnA [Kiritimatiellae bacterium]|jgi:phosphoesterase RecJ-like protein|nr:bifunctional oligoribonuclease/PAP phosphatase NrnA [Kiritimatiellia bacterium]
MKKRNTKNVTASEIIKVISRAKKVLISGHVRPDGDSVGCMIALAHILNKAGIDATATASKKGLGGPQFLNGVKQMITPRSASRKSYDLVITVDCGSLDRVPEELHKTLGKSPVINIDHHRTNTRFGDYNFVHGEASSTGELIWKLGRQAGWKHDNISAEALWVALITDTGRFAYDMTAPSTMRCGADLLKYGVRTAYINDQLYCSFSRINMELKRRAFRSLTVSENNTIATVTLTGRDFEEIGGTKADAEDIIEMPRSLIGNKVAIFFYGSEDNEETRISLRTREPLDATTLIAQFDGGGHPRAAGCTIKAPLSKAKRIMNLAIKKWMKEQEG